MHYCCEGFNGCYSEGVETPLKHLVNNDSSKWLKQPFAYAYSYNELWVENVQSVQKHAAT